MNVSPLSKTVSLVMGVLTSKVPLAGICGVEVYRVQVVPASVENSRLLEPTVVTLAAAP